MQQYPSPPPPPPLNASQRTQQEASASPPAEAPKFAKGNKVKVHSLQGADFLHFNGEIGEVAGPYPHARDRVLVRLHKKVIPFSVKNISRIFTIGEREASTRLKQRQEEILREERPFPLYTSLIPNKPDEEPQTKIFLPDEAPIAPNEYTMFHEDHELEGYRPPPYHSPLADGSSPEAPAIQPSLRPKPEHLNTYNASNPSTMFERKDGVWGEPGLAASINHGHHPNSPLATMGGTAAMPEKKREEDQTYTTYEEMVKQIGRGGPVAALQAEEAHCEAELKHKQKALQDMTDSVQKWKLFVIDQQRRAAHQQTLIDNEAVNLEHQGNNYINAIQEEIEGYQLAKQSSEQSHHRIQNEIIPETLARNYTLSAAPHIIEKVLHHANLPPETFRDMTISWGEKCAILKNGLKSLGLTPSGEISKSAKKSPHKVILTAERLFSAEEAAQLQSKGIFKADPTKTTGNASRTLTYQLSVPEAFFVALRKEVGVVSGSRGGGVSVLNVVTAGREEWVGLQVVVNEDFLRYACERVKHKGIDIAVWGGGVWERCSSKDFWGWRRAVVSVTHPSPPPPEPPVHSRAAYVTVHILVPAEPALSGHYVEQTADAEGNPTFLNRSNGYILYTDVHGRWKVGAVAEAAQSLGLVKSKYPHAGLPPWSVPSWTRLSGEVQRLQWEEDHDISISYVKASSPF